MLKKIWKFITDKYLKIEGLEYHISEGDSESPILRFYVLRELESWAVQQYHDGPDKIGQRRIQEFYKREGFTIKFGFHLFLVFRGGGPFSKYVLFILFWQNSLTKNRGNIGPTPFHPFDPPMYL
jgi:hypothetical protein